MAKRSSNGRQQPKQRADGRWYVFIEIGRVAGKRQRKALYGKTRGEVTAKLKAAEQQHASGADIASRQTVEQYLMYWLDNVASRKVTPETLRAYRRHVALYIIPHIGHIRLRALDARDVERMQIALLQRLAPNSVALMRSVLIGALNVALKRGEIIRNVASLVEAPTIPETAMPVLSVEQVAQFYRALAGHRWEALFRAALTLGWRKSELLALRWCDIDFDAQIIKLTGALKRRGGQLIRDRTKTKATVREAPLPSNLADAFSARWSIQAREFAKLDRVPQPNDFVFTTRTGSPVTHESIWDTFKRLLKKAGLPDMPMHGLRHSCAVLLVEQNAHPAIIRDVLGHASIGTTMDKYVKRVPQAGLRIEIDALDALLGGSKDGAK